MIDRLKVRVAYQRGFQVVDGSTILQSFDNKEDAFKFVHARGARVWLRWDRTVIGGQTVPYDFDAKFLQDSVGRIKKELHGPSAGTWFWSSFEGGARGSTETRDEAVACVERAYTRYVIKADWR
ncbi:MAG: hypothetical protein E5X51_23390 [Mesorhizobium sp.]|uniref:hypothetical protein n=1 Tax=Mesorhizobium sp. TaxID=1871066 RepID=UPI001201FD70|nr:hypothetical protein [Mesorhizobium sp.]TIQ18871.1 MAG: hypothetical protein E5X51_23390 [Mesorhizobium sp.]